MAEYSIDKRTTMLMLVVIAFVSLIDGLDGGIVNVALPTLAKDFSTDTSTISWVTAIYFIMMAGLMIPFARIAKNGHIRKVLFVGLAIFTVSSLLCGISMNFPMLLICRAIQGMGAAMMGAAVPMLCVKFLPSCNLGLGLGVLTMGSALGFALGPALGGIITEIISWHWIFLINVPLGIIILPLVLKTLPKDPKSSKNLKDISGALLLFSTVLFGAISLERASHGSDSMLAMISAILFLTCLVLFILVELKKDDPMLNVRVFTHHKFNLVFLAFLLVCLAYMGMAYLMPFYMSNTLGFSSSESGLYLLLAPVVTLILSVPISRWSDRTGRRWFSVASCFVLLIAFVLMAMFSREKMLLPLIISLLFMGLMWALCGGPMGSRIIEEVSDESREMGSTLMNESVYLGGTIGTTLFAMLFAIGSGAGSIDFSDLPTDIFMDGFVFSMIAGAVITFIALVASLVVRDKKAL
jgi:Arabinose efflux permease